MGTLTTGEVGLLAPVVGGALVVGGSWLTRVWNRNDDAARWKREDTIATRDRIRAAYFGLVDECVAAKRVLQWQPDDETIPDELFDVMQNVDRHALVIPDTEIRARVENLSGIMWQADRIAPSLPVAKTPNTVAFEAAAGLDDLACALIRGEP
ncbi:MAG: hypothetical protein QOG49_774, partial [Frankiaceae bacterium]|nr:hypothetical protein [Frankiaceae bacterium]